MKVYEVCEISHDLEIGKYYNLIGLINSKPLFSNPSRGVTMQRFSAITVDRVQLIIEIWNRDEKTALRFANEWRILQLVFLQDARYYGTMNMGISEFKEVYIFRIPARRVTERLIWLSSPTAQFWRDPLLPRKCLENLIASPDIRHIEQQVNA